MANLLDGVTEDQRDDSTEGLGRIMIYRDPAPQGDNLVPANGNKLTQAVAPEPQGDLAANIAKLRELVANFGTGILDQLGVAGMQPGPKREAAVTGRNAMLGIGDEQNLPWPQRMIRSGTTLPGDVASGEQPVIDPETGRTSGRLIERTQDLAGLAGGGALTERPGVATLGSGPTRPNIGNVAMKPTEPAPVFYSALEHAVENSAQNTATPEQWAGFLKNTPGVKAEEIQWTGIGDWLAQQKGKVSKDDVKAYLDEHKIELKDVTKIEGVNDRKAGSISTRADLLVDDEGIPHTEAIEIARREHMEDPHNFEEMYGNFEPEERGGPKYSSYQLPGGENYREHLLTLKPRLKEVLDAKAAKKRLNQLYRKLDLTPEENAEAMRLESQMDMGGRGKQPTFMNNYTSSHWDEPNVLAHVRTNDRMMPGPTKTVDIGDGETATMSKPLKSLHIEEIQSDWHQQGRKQGYKQEEPKIVQGKQDFAPGSDSYGKEGYKIEGTNNWFETKKEAEDAVKHYSNITGVPDAPFKTTWPELALKRMIRHAAENGYDRISWTPGEAQAARYDLSKHYQDVRAYKNSDGSVNVWGRPAGVAGPRDVQHIAKGVSPEKLPDIVGKELADKIVNQKPEYEKTYSGVDLKVGGEGMREFYDKMLPKMAEKIGKAHGVKVKTTNLSGDKPYRQEQTGLWYVETGGDKQLGPFASEAEANKAVKLQPVHYFDLPQSLREHAVGKGFPLYMSGVPFPLTPVDHDPFKKERK